jgi:hypothetical protein
MMNNGRDREEVSKEVEVRGCRRYFDGQGKTALRRYGERSLTVGESETGPSARTFLLGSKG